MILWPVSIELIIAWVMNWHLGNFTDCYCYKIGMNYTASHCVRLDENQAGPLSERRSWPRFFQYNFSVRLSKDKHSKIFQKNIINKENCFIFHNIMIMLLVFFLPLRVRSSFGKPSFIFVLDDWLETGKKSKTQSIWTIMYISAGEFIV